MPFCLELRSSDSGYRRHEHAANSFWAELFIRARLSHVRFVPTDLLGKSNGRARTAQNTFLYVRPGHPLHAALSEKGRIPSEIRLSRLRPPVVYTWALEDRGAAAILSYLPISLGRGFAGSEAPIAA
jgi:hypothetical protein